MQVINPFTILAKPEQDGELQRFVVEVEVVETVVLEDEAHSTPQKQVGLSEAPSQGKSM